MLLSVIEHKQQPPRLNNTVSKILTQRGSNERLFILTRTHSMHIFWEIPFIKPQKDT